MIEPVVDAFEELLVRKERVEVGQGDLDRAERAATSLVLVLQHVGARSR